MRIVTRRTTGWPNKTGQAARGGVWLAWAAIAVLAAGGAAGCRRGAAPDDTHGAAPGAAAREASGEPADGRLWFLGDADLRSEVPAGVRRADGRPPDVSCLLFVWNPAPEPASVTLRIYSASAAPRSLPIAAAGRHLTVVDVAGREDIPRDGPLWFVLEADRPVFPQLRHSFHRPWDEVPDTLTAPLPRAGPLDEADRALVYPDGFQGGTESWYEQELVTVLNPGHRDARVRLTFRFRDGRSPLQTDVIVPAERAFPLRAWTLFGVTGDDSTSPRVSGDYAMLLESDTPVASQQTRLARWRGERHISGSRPFAPLRAALGETREWYLPGGWVRSLGLLPRDDYTSFTWHLLFTHNLDPRGKRRLSVTIHDAAGRTRRSGTLAVGPARSDLQWLHSAPWRGEQVPLDEPWAAVLRTDGQLVPDVTLAEFDAWSQAMPGAMAATGLVPGPLTDEREWWLGAFTHGAAESGGAEWSAAWQLFNPGQAEVRVGLQFLGLPSGPLEYSVTIGPGAVARVTGDQVAGLPHGKPFVVRATADQPFTAQGWLRVATQGVPGTRAMASGIGVPMALVP